LESTLDTVTVVGRRCRDAETTGETSEAMLLLGWSQKPPFADMAIEAKQQRLSQNSISDHQIISPNESKLTTGQIRAKIFRIQNF
jgi:hypothetical protein